MGSFPSSNHLDIALIGTIYFLTVIVVGFPMMYTLWILFNGLFTTLGVGWFVHSEYGIVLIGIAFVIGMYISEKISERTIQYFHNNFN